MYDLSNSLSSGFVFRCKNRIEYRMQNVSGENAFCILLLNVR